MEDEAKLDPEFHVPEEDPEIHLQRLLTPRSLDEPFYKTIAKTVKELTHPPKLPPLEITSKPVDPSELKGLNGLYAGNETRAGLGSLIVHLAIIGALLFLGSLKPVQKAVKEMTTLILPPMPMKAVEKPMEQKSGGGGARQAVVKHAELPKPVRQFIAPAEHFQTQLAAPVSVNADLPDIDPTAIGSVSGLNAFAGTGAVGGFGNGKGGGIGSGNGNGTGPGSGEGSGGDVYRPGGPVSFPIPIDRPEPQYSDEARRARREGDVLVSFVVDERGKPIRVKVIHPLGMGLDEKAIEAVSHWTFKPGMKDGKPVAVQSQMYVTFRLL